MLHNKINNSNIIVFKKSRIICRWQAYDSGPVLVTALPHLEQTNGRVKSVENCQRH